MSAANGQFTRRIGLTLEMFCMFGLLAAMRGKLDSWMRLGFDPSLIFSCGLAIGFCLWLWGTVLIFQARKASRNGS
ncbi:MAG: hypothetical protein U0835_15780 [Isosphaeraceae bacterium]